MSQPRIVTSYLAHPLWRVKRDGVLRVPVCRQLRWYADRKDAYWPELVPSADAVELGRKWGEFGLYRLELSRADLLYVHVSLDAGLTYPAVPPGLVVLLCWEGDPRTCHRRFAFEALTGRPWTPADEVKSPYGGLAEVNL